MCEDTNSGWKRGTMESTRYDHKEAASSYHVSSSVCLQQRKLSTIFFDKAIYTVANIINHDRYLNCVFAHP